LPNCDGVADEGFTFNPYGCLKVIVVFRILPRHGEERDKEEYGECEKVQFVEVSHFVLLFVTQEKEEFGPRFARGFGEFCIGRDIAREIWSGL